MTTERKDPADDLDLDEAGGFIFIELDQLFHERWFRAMGHRPGPGCPRCTRRPREEPAFRLPTNGS